MFDPVQTGLLIYNSLKQPQIITKQKGRYNTIQLCAMRICSFNLRNISIKLLLLLLLLLRFAYITKKVLLRACIIYQLNSHTYPCNDDNYSRTVTPEAWISPGAGLLVASRRGVNFRFWSHLGCSGQNTIIFSRKGLFQGYTQRNIKKLYIFNSFQLLYSCNQSLR